MDMRQTSAFGSTVKKYFFAIFPAVTMIIVFGASSNGGNADFEAIRAAAEAYLGSGRPLDIDAKTLYESMVSSMALLDVRNYDPSSFKRGPIIVDLRAPDPEMPQPYAVGHIPGSVPIPLRNIADWKYLKDLPKDRKIVVYSATGQVGGQAAAILNLLGYDAVNLKWGMTSWAARSDIAPGRYESSRDTVWRSGGSYRTVVSLDSPQEIYDFPDFENGDGRDNFETILSAARLYFNALDKPFTISAPELDALLRSSENPYVVPLVLDVRDEAAYRLGHIDKCLHIPLRALFRRENLRHLPPDRQIVVYCETGHESAQAVAVLNLLGYDAVSLKWGIAAWSLSLPGSDITPNRYDERHDCMGYEVVTGFRSFIPCAG
jgi:rhodanese-related sulfurtransferase